ANRSLFYNTHIRGHSNRVMCALPNSTLTDRAWVTSNGSSVDCNTNPLRCYVVSSNHARLILLKIKIMRLS
uniref:Uncharacterized protein n=1 Tax=Amphimedon queenslandica TaxID=400682 RepID=A0A1X7V4B4_AMPQE